MGNPTCPAGGHPVYSHTYAIARVGGVLLNLWAVGVGLWILAFGEKIFARQFWHTFVDTGVYDLAGWFILVGGVLGVLGLIRRSRILSLAAAAICALWCGIISAFLWWGNFADYPSIGSFMATLATFVYIQRFWLIKAHPPKIDPYVSGETHE